MEKNYKKLENLELEKIQEISEQSNLRNKLIKVSVSIFAVLLIFVLGAQAAVRTSAGTGNWGAGGTWVGGVAPVAGDDVVIASGHVVTVNGNYTCNTLVINAAANNNGITIASPNSLTVTGAITMNVPSNNNRNSTIAVGTGTLTAASIAIPGSGTANRNCIVSLSTGTINVSGNVTFSGTAAQAQLTFTGAGFLNIAGAAGLGAGGTFTASTGTVEFNAAGAQAFNPYTYNNLTLSGSGAKTSALTTVNGNFTLSGTATYTTGAAV